MNEKFIEHFVAIYREMVLLHSASVTFPDRCEAVRRLSVDTIAGLSLVYMLNCDEQNALCARLDAFDREHLATIVARVPSRDDAVH